jgi:hypothetical protein
MDKERNIKELAFVVPTDVVFEQPVNDLSPKLLQRYHDVLHVLFNKLQDGLGEFREFTWTFNKVIYKHSEVVREMTKRGIRHYYPINNLDKIHADASEYSISQLSKESNEDELDEEIDELFGDDDGEVKDKDSEELSLDFDSKSIKNLSNSN